ncbi:hypothetical protein WJX79_007396 [Trebouxia sp. C0005]
MSCQFVLALFLLGLCICGTSEAVAGLQECTDLLADSAVYYLDLDVADQRAALIDFYDSTGGQYWVNQPADDSEHVIFPQIVEGMIEAGNGLTSGTLDYLSLGRQWLKYSWGSNVSYCHWSGITCCQTGSGLQQQCIGGPQSIAQLVLSDVNLTGSIPADFFEPLEDLQVLLVDGNPG